MQGFISGDLGFQGLEFRVRGVGVQANSAEQASFIPKMFRQIRDRQCWDIGEKQGLFETRMAVLRGKTSSLPKQAVCKRSKGQGPAS